MSQKKAKSSELDGFDAELTEVARPKTPKEIAESLRKRNSELRDKKRDDRAVKYLMAQLEAAERALEIQLSTCGSVPVLPIKGKPSRGAKQACPIIVASDWHVEEPVVSDHVNGRNEYSPDIARKRAARFAEGALWLLDTHRSGTKIEEMVLALIGDFITGWIHEELISGNALNPIEAIMLAQEILYGVIKEILTRSGLKIRVICSRGNHGRITKKTYINQAATTSFEYLMYHNLAMRFAGDSRISFTIEHGYHTYVPIYDKVVRFHHGDAVSFQGGVGGLTIPMRKAIAQWNQGQRADLDIIGHFHQLFDGGNFIVNGSLIGWNDYATWIKAAYEPPQQVFVLMRPVRGKSGTAPIFVT